MAKATPFNDEQLRDFAQAMVKFHDPANQQDNPYERCAHCSYTRHPCDTFDLAAAVLRLLDKVKQLGEAYDNVSAAYIEATNPGIDMDEVRRSRPRFMLNTKTGEVTQLVDDGLGFPEMRHE